MTDITSEWLITVLAWLGACAIGHVIGYHRGFKAGKEIMRRVYKAHPRFDE